MDLNFQKDNFKDQSKLSIQKLAFVGDAVFELIVRSKIVDSLQGSIGDLNSIKVKIVCCSAQSKLFEKIKNVLTEEDFANSESMQLLSGLTLQSFQLYQQLYK